MKQFLLTPSMGKRLIGKAMVHHPDIKRVLEKGTLVIIAGTTNGYVAEEILKSLGQAEGFSREGFRRGITIAPGSEAIKADLLEDVVIINGKRQKGKTIFDVENNLKAGDVILKGGNAFDIHGQAAVLVAHPKGGTILAAITAVVGKRVRLIVPIGLEKRVLEDVKILALKCNAPEAEGLRLMPAPGKIFTELDAVKLMTEADASLIAAGGVYGAEGSVWLGISGNEKQIQAAEGIMKSLTNEPLCIV